MKAGAAAGLRAYAIACAAAAVATVPMARVTPQAGDLRNWQIAFAVLLGLWLVKTRSGWLEAAAELRLSRAERIALAAAALAWLLGAQAMSLWAFRVNGFDFSIFDWMLNDTLRGRFMYSPIYGVNHLGVHTSYVLLPFVPLHWLLPTPYLLACASALAIWAGVFPLWRLGARFVQGDGLRLLLVIAYLTCPWTGFVLDGGFRPEVFFPAAGLWFITAWVEGRRREWAAAAVLFLAIREDAAIYLGAAAAGSLAFERDRRREAGLLLAGCAAAFAANVFWAQPYFLRGSAARQPAYVDFWRPYGRTLPEIAWSMARAPWRVAWDVARSGWYKVFAPALFLPLLSRRPLAAMLPTLVIMGSAATWLRTFRGYNAVTLLPFFLWGLLEGAENLSVFRVGPAARRWVLALVLLAFPLVGDGYVRVRWPDPALRAEMDAVALHLGGTRGPVCAQTALFPQLPYDLDLQPISRECLEQPGAVGVLTTRLDPYPYGAAEVDGWLRQPPGGQAVEARPAGFALLLPPGR